MTETDISKVLIEGDYATIMGVKYKRVQEQEFTLELTLDELHMLDKYVEYCEETKEFFDKLKNAYPRPRMEAERSGEVHIVFYNKKTYYRIEYTDEFGYVVWWRREKQDDTSRLVMVTDKETERLLEGLWFNEVKGGKYD